MREKTSKPHAWGWLDAWQTDDRKACCCFKMLKRKHVSSFFASRCLYFLSPWFCVAKIIDPTFSYPSFFFGACRLSLSVFLSHLEHCFVSLDIYLPLFAFLSCLSFLFLLAICIGCTFIQSYSSYFVSETCDVAAYLPQYSRNTFSWFTDPAASHHYT